MKEPPCKECKQRSIECHIDCKNYNEWKKEYDELMKKKHSEEYLASYDTLSRARTVRSK